ncbi:MAG: hypothetical protein ABJE95_05705 [Byssovorax sp.]
MSAWIDLERFLLPLEATDEESSLSATLYTPVNALNWIQVLPGPCLVVLGEAGIGKTSELRGQAQRLRSEGHGAFFVPIDALAKDGLEIAIEGSAGAFEDWKQGQAEAWFFLDSVDEAKFTGESLQRAIKKLASALSGALGRCHVVVSSRHSDWNERDKEELSLFADRLIKPSSPSRGSESRRARSRGQTWTPFDPDIVVPIIPVRVLWLAPLNRAQIRTYAEQKEGLSDVDAFVTALGRADFWGLAGRPLDVEWLAGFWKRNRVFGSLRTMIEENIHEKLTDMGRDPVRYPSPISPAQAREGVERIALTLTMVGSSAVVVPGAENMGVDDRVEVLKILENWTVAETLGLMRLAVFDPAINGRARFHVRTVREYLAASCLHRLRQRNLTELQLDRLLFASVEEREIVRPGFEALVAWLAINDSAVRRRALKVAPEHLIDLGDPSELPFDTRRLALREYIARFAGRKRTLHHFHGAGLERFAKEDLSAELREALAPGVSDDLRKAVLQMIERKQLTSLADAALKVAAEDGIPSFLRVRAIHAVAVAGSIDQKRAIVNSMTPRFAEDRDTAHELLERFFPGVLSISEVIGILEAAHPRRGFVDGYHSYLRNIGEVCPVEFRCDLLTNLVELFERLTVKKGNGVFRFLEWAPAIVVLLDGVLQSEGTSPVPVSVCVRLLKDVGRDDIHLHVELEKELIERTFIRRAVFWDAVARAREMADRWPHTISDLQIEYPLFPSMKDADWLETDASDHSDVEGRVLAFDALIRVLWWSKAEQDRERVKRVAQKRPELAAHLQFSTDPRPLSQEDLDAINRMEQLSLLSESQIQQQKRWYYELLRREVPCIRSGENIELLFGLVDAGRRDSNAEWSASNVAELYDSEIAAAAVEGFCRIWNEQEFPAPHDVAVNRTPYICTAGALGFELLIRQGLDIASLDETRLRRAVTLSAWQLNRFPGWLDVCAELAPWLLRDVFGPSLVLDYSTEQNGRLLSKLASASESVRSACAPILIGLIRASEPQHETVFAFVFQALKDVPGCGIELIELCHDRCVASLHAPKKFAMWWKHWFAADLRAAVSFLRDRVSVRERLEVADAAVLECCRGERQELLLTPSSDDVKSLIELLRIILQHIRHAEDTDNFNSVRHDAQAFRWRLAGAISEIGTLEAARGLNALAIEPWIDDWWRDLLKRSADDCAARVVMRRWSLEDAVHFLDSGSLLPQTSGDLFDVVVEVLEEVRHFITYGDDSPRAAYDRNDQDEVQFQILLLICLGQRARGRYTVARESELADATRPDLRIWAKELGPVSMEIKVVEKGWSLQKLEDAIEAQLVGQYMKDARARYGVLVLVSAGKPRERWEKPGTSITTFGALVKHLMQVAATVRHRLPYIEGLAVVGIDFHEPNTSKASPRRLPPAAPRTGK